MNLNFCVADFETEPEREPDLDLEPELEREPDLDLEPELEREPDLDLEPELDREPDLDLEPELERDLDRAGDGYQLADRASRSTFSISFTSGTSSATSRPYRGLCTGTLTRTR